MLVLDGVLGVVDDEVVKEVGVMVIVYVLVVMSVDVVWLSRCVVEVFIVVLCFDFVYGVVLVEFVVVGVVVV